MAFNPASPVTGATITGLTSPTYTLGADSAPDVNGTALAVTALGGTQTGVTTSSASNPFTVLFTRPKVLRNLPPVGVNGILAAIPRNVYTLSIRHGVTVLAGQPIVPFLIRTEFSLPAGADTADPANVKAALSAYFGIGWEQASAIALAIIAGSK